MHIEFTQIIIVSCVPEIQLPSAWSLYCKHGKQIFREKLCRKIYMCRPKPFLPVSVFHSNAYEESNKMYSFEFTALKFDLFE